MFYSGGKLIEAYSTVDENGKIIKLDISPDDIFGALFAIMFAGFQMGNAAGFGPDMGKAMAACARVFGIIEYPSKIDAIAINESLDHVRLIQGEVKGKLEFKDVWFRYPTRKEDFVLKGLNLTINPNEVIALVVASQPSLIS
jgi:ATP-binding cassette, subfamily B (MDR/TAP), member 1